MVSLPAIDGLQ